MAFGACSLRFMTTLGRGKNAIDCVHSKGPSQNYEGMIYLEALLIDVFDSHSDDECDPFLKSVYWFFHFT